MDSDSANREITRESLINMPGPVLVEFGAPWCGICQAFAPHLQELLKSFPEVQHLKVEDGKGKRLGRSFGVKLWPTLVFLRDGHVQQQLVRPDARQARQALEHLVKVTEI